MFDPVQDNAIVRFGTGQERLNVAAFGRNGASETRTRDLLHAMQALSQLSYGPGDFAEPLANSVTHLTALAVIRQPTRGLN